MASYLKSLALFASLVTAVAVSDNEAHVFKRGDVELLDRQITCIDPGFIPACPVGIPCVPPGSICCDDGITYVFPPDTCPAGTHPVATASTSFAPVITPAPTPSPGPVVENFFTATFTFYYFIYYYTYLEIIHATTLTSSRTTVYTTLSITAQNEAAASSSLSALSATIAFPTPAQTTTSLVGTIPATSVPTYTSTSSVSGAPSPTVTAVGTGGGPTPPKPTSTFSQVPVSGAGKLGGMMGWAMGLAVVVPGIAMVVL